MKPRERLLALGPKTLTDGELVAILLRTGIRGKGVVELAEDLVTENAGLSGLFDRSVDNLLSVKGLGKAKVATLAAVMELSRRYYESQLTMRDNRFSAPCDVHAFLKSHVPNDGSERFYVLFLDSQGALIEFELMFRGNHSAAPVFISEILKKAISTLSEEQREVFLMREDLDLSFAEISELIGCPSNTAKSRMRYALEHLRKTLELQGITQSEVKKSEVSRM